MEDSEVISIEGPGEDETQIFQEEDELVSINFVFNYTRAQSA